MKKSLTLNTLITQKQSTSKLDSDCIIEIIGAKPIYT